MNKDKKKQKKGTLIYSQDLKPHQVICRTDVRHQLTSLKKPFSGGLNLNVLKLSQMSCNQSSIYLSIYLGSQWVRSGRHSVQVATLTHLQARWKLQFQRDHMSLKCWRKLEHPEETR